MNPKAKTVSGAEPKKETKKKQRSSAAKFILMVTKILIIFFIAISFAIAGIVGGAIVGYIKTATPISDDQILKMLGGQQTTFIYDMNGKEIGKLTGSSENIDRILVKDSEIPKGLKDAFIALEDERFEEHNGVDLIGFSRVVIKKLLNPNSSGGASTITMQLIKNITNEKSVTIQRKVQEQWRAIQLEKKLQKWQILEAYLNIIPMGGNSYGVQSASLKYFGVPVKELDIAQCATLAAITQLPNYYAPDTDKGKEHNKVRQEVCLKKMFEQGKISQSEYDAAMNEDLNTKFVQKSVVKTENREVRTYFVDQVMKDVQKGLKELGYSEQTISLTLYGGGLKIYTSLDPDVQSAIDEVYNDEKTYFPGVKNKKGELPQSAMVIIDPKTGAVRGMVGGRGEKTGDSVFNRATQTKRQAGSSFKPIADYGPAINERLITAASIIDDVPVYMLGLEKPRYPEDFPNSSGKREYRGLTDIRTAIARSINIVAAQVFMNLTPNISFNYLEKSGIDMTREDKVLSIALGGLKDGVSPMKMAAAYVPFVHKGMYYEPITYTKVLDSAGAVIIDRSNKSSPVSQKSNIVYDETTAFIMTDMLRSVVNGPGGTATYVKLTNSNKKVIPIAAKTGTTNEDKDRWFMGFTPSYVGAVWYGYDTPTEIKLGKARNPSAIIWNAVMQKIYSKSTDIETFQQPEGLIKKTICIKSGKIATLLCAKDISGTSAVRQEYFIKGTEPKDTDLCDVHVSAKVDTLSKDLFGRNLLANPNCPLTSVAEKVFIRRPQPYIQIKPDDPYPLDFMFELPLEYCDLHGTGINDGTTATATPESSATSEPTATPTPTQVP